MGSPILMALNKSNLQHKFMGVSKWLLQQGYSIQPLLIW